MPQSASQPLTLNVAAAVPALTITTTSLPDAQVGVAYSQQLAASGGTSPFIWSVSVGSLPAGLTLSASGLLSGTPIVSGAFNFTVQVVDSGV